MSAAFDPVSRTTSSPRRSNRSAAPPGPSELDFVRTHARFMTDQVGFLHWMRAKYGLVSQARLGMFQTMLVYDPELIEEVLVKRASLFHKDALTHDLEEMLGRGLLTNEGEDWRRQRKLAAPALTRRQISTYADWMVELTNAEVDRWQDGEEVELHHRMMELTLRIVVKTLFNLDIEERIDAIGHAVDEAMEVFHKYTHTPWRFVPRAIPTPLSRKFDRSIEFLDEVVYDLIAKRRASNEEGDDLLYRFLIANDEDGNGMTDKQLRDEVLTMFLAGHETTALAVTYAWYLLTKNPWAMQRLHEEVDEVLGDRPATADDVREMPYLNQVIKETMRMYSPAWLIGREALEDLELGPYRVPKGTQVLFPQVVMHYEEQYFPKPHEFRPERWHDGFEKSLPRFAYFPFGGGPRVCIGNHFANMEAALMIATMAQRFGMENRMAGPLKTAPAITLRPSVPVNVRMVRRR